MSTVTTAPSQPVLQEEFETALLKKFDLPDQESSDPDIQELHRSIRYAISLYSSMWADQEVNGQNGRGHAAAVEQLLNMQRQNIGSNVQQALMQMNALPPKVTK